MYNTYDNQPRSELQEQGSVVVDAVDLIFEPKVKSSENNLFSANSLENIQEVIDSFDNNSVGIVSIVQY